MKQIDFPLICYPHGVKNSLVDFKVVRFDLRDLCNEIGYISKIRKMRNLIVHNGGYLPNDGDNEVNRFAHACLPSKLASYHGQIHSHPEHCAGGLDQLISAT